MHNHHVILVVTHLVLKESVSDILSYSRHKQNIVLGFPLALGVDAVVKNVPFILDKL